MSLKETNGTPHQRRLLNTIRKLSDYIATDKGIAKAPFWDAFEGWVKENKEECNTLATRYMCEFVKERENMKSANQLVTYQLIAFKKWGIAINTKLDTVLNAKKRKWEKNNESRIEVNKKKKSEQFVNIKEHLTAMVRYMSETDRKTFREHAQRAMDSSSNGAFTKSALAEIKTVSNATTSVVRTTLLKVRAFMLMAKVTGLRWISFQRMTRENVTWRDGMLLITYRKKNSSKLVFGHVAIAPHANAAECAVLAYAQYITSVPDVAFPFTFGHRKSTDHVRARVAALLDFVAWAVGSSQGFGLQEGACHALLLLLHARGDETGHP